MGNYNKKEVLKDNILAIKSALSGENNKELLLNYKGFGGIKSVLINPSDEGLYPNADKPLIPLFKELHEVLKEYSKSEDEYANYYNSLRNSVLTSFYTPSEVVESINRVLVNNDIVINKLLDPSSGAGVFLEHIDAKQKDAFEKDLITGKILSGIYPDYTISVSGFEKAPRSMEGEYDVVASNIPFGDFRVFDPVFFGSKDKLKKQSCDKIHNYFFVKSGDMLKEGGITAFITSTGVMDAQSNEPIRRHLLTNHTLISAIRLPENLFLESGTEVQSDLIVLQKNSNRGKLTSDENAFIKSKEIAPGVFQNSYYKDSLNIIHTSSRLDTNMYGSADMRYIHSGGVKGIAEQLLPLLQEGFSSNFDISLYNQNSEKQKEFSYGSAVQLDLFGYEDIVLQDNRVVIEKTQQKEFEYEKLSHHKAGDYVCSSDGLLVGVALEGSNKASILDITSGRDKDIILHYTRVRDCYYKLDYYENQFKKENQGLRKSLNEAYDEFSKLSNFKDSDQLLKTDSLYKEVRGLQYLEDNKITKADIFFAPIAFSLKSSYTVEEAYYQSLNNFNNINLDYISSLAMTTRENVISELKDKIYFNPISNTYEQAVTFLSGDVITKYNNIAKYAETSSSREIQESLQALKNVIPDKIPFENIGINLGERWISDAIYSDFVRILFNDDSLEVKYNPSLDAFNMSETGWSANDKWGVACVNRKYKASDVFCFAMKDSYPIMNMKILVNGEAKTVSDSEGMQKMNMTIEKIKNEFHTYLYQLPNEKKEHLENLYNQKFNCFVKSKYNGDFQTFPGLDLKALGYSEVRKSQKDAVYMLKNNMGGVIDHEVGNGKTLTMCLASYEMKRLGLANKPLMVCMKANVGEISETFKKAYPHAKLLCSVDEDMTKQERDKFYAKVKNNNWDCVIMSHEQFAKIPQSAEISSQIISEELDKLRQSKLDLGDLDEEEKRRVLKNLLNQETKLEAKLEILNFLIAQKRDDLLDFKTMGFDHIMVDESHQFKNLFFTTKHNRVSGLGKPKGSEKAFNMLLAIRTIQNQTGKDLGATFLSGTTISNSMTELYSLFNYLRPNALARQVLSFFDAWAATYTEKAKEFEFNVVGNLVQKERFRYFIKVPELASFYSQICDYKTAKDAGIDKPKANEILIELEQTAEQMEMFERLKEFAKTADGPTIFREPLSEKEENAKMLIATNTALKASLDMRLIDSEMFSDDKGNKTSACADKIHEYYEKYNHIKGTQFVFCDSGVYKNNTDFNIYSDIKSKLIEKGIPSDEIQFIHQNDTEKKKKILMDNMNSGEVRVLFGSTQKLGTGVNAQKKCVAMHNIDIPWRPSDLEQRYGRGARPGNEVAKEFCDNKVDTLIYGVKSSLDTYKLSIVHAKQTFISQIKNQSIGVRRIDEGGMDEHSGANHAEYIAILSGNQDILKKAKIEKEITKLKNEEQIHYKEVRRLSGLKNRYMEEVGANNKYLAKFDIDKTKCDLIPKDDKGNINYKITIQGVEYTDIKQAGEKLVEVIDKDSLDTVNYENVGKFYNFSLLKKVDVLHTIDGLELRTNKLFIGGEAKYSYNNGNLAKTPELAGVYPIRALEKIAKLQETYQKKNEDLHNNIKYLPSSEDVFPKNDKLKELEKDLAKINQDIAKSISQNNEVRRDDRFKDKDDFRM